MDLTASMKTIGIYTKNFRLYHDLVTLLKTKHLSYVSLDSLHHVPNQIGVIITSNNEIHDTKRKNVIAADAYDSLEDAIEKAKQSLIGKDLYHHVYIGIDPGEKPGIALICDDILLATKQASSPEQVRNTITWFINQYPAHDYIIRIGHGSILLRNRIINSLIPLNIPIEIVNESKTSSHQTQRIGRDMQAAATIALLQGGKVQQRLPLKPTRGELRRIQEESRKLTNGSFSISKTTARLVLQGHKSLTEAIEQEKNERRINKN